MLYTPNPDFTLLTPAIQTTPAGGSAQFPLTYLPAGTFTSTVGFSVAGLPAGVSASFGPLSSGACANQGSYGSCMTVTVPAGVLASTTPYQMMITASALTPAGCTTTCTTVTHTEYAWLKISAGGPGFSISATPITATTVAPGGQAQYTIQVNSTGGYTGTVNLSTSGGPPGASISLSANSAQAGGSPVTLTVTTASGTPLSTYITAITGMAGGVPQYTSVPTIVTCRPQLAF